jgi:hypothetical protein
LGPQPHTHTHNMCDTPRAHAKGLVPQAAAHTEGRQSGSLARACLQGFIHCSTLPGLSLVISKLYTHCLPACSLLLILWEPSQCHRPAAEKHRERESSVRMCVRVRGLLWPNNLRCKSKKSTNLIGGKVFNRDEQVVRVNNQSSVVACCWE